MTAPNRFGTLVGKLFLKARENCFSAANFVSRLNADLRAERQKNIDPRSEPDEANPFSANDRLAARDPRNDPSHPDSGD
jgi:hypothetical protein